MSADVIRTTEKLLAGPGSPAPELNSQIVVTNGVQKVSITVRIEKVSSRGDISEERLDLPALTAEQAQLLADALIRKAVNVSRGVHDNDREAI